MANLERNGSRKIRGQLFKQRIPKLGYYFIVTDTKETEQNYKLYSSRIAGQVSNQSG